MRKLPSHRNRCSQTGFGLLLLLGLLGLAVLFVAVSQLNAFATRRSLDTTTRDSLQHAKQALIGYAATYRDTHSATTPPTFGYLPCPAIDGNGVAGNCGSAGTATIGFLPFKTLNLPDLRDSTSECLWYAVSGSIKNAPAQLQLNWDVQGQFIVVDTSGAVLATPNAQDGGPVALIIAPGEPLAGQARTAASTPCGKAPAYADFIEAAPLFPNAGPVTMTKGAPSSQTVNDQVVWITAKEVFDRINQRSDFAAQINGLIGEMSNCLGNGMPNPDSPQTIGSNLFGLVPTTSITGTPSYCPPAPGYGVNADQIHYWRNWRELFRYMKCGSGSQCATVNGSSCRGVLLFGGQRTSSQSRTSAADKTDPANYLEGTNAAAWAVGGSSYSGPVAYDPVSPTQDVARCLN
jgi:hypothetical protein